MTRGTYVPAGPTPRGRSAHKRGVPLGWVVRVAVVLGLVLGAGFGSAGIATAHSALERSVPADGSPVAVLPDQVTLTFNQNVLGLGTVLQVSGPAGEVAEGAPTVVDNTVTQPIRPGSPPGVYTVLWRVTSADGHPISGKFGFTAAAASIGTAQTAPDAASAGSADAGEAEAPAESESGATVLWLLVAGIAVLAAGGVVISRRRPGNPGSPGNPGGTD